MLLANGAKERMLSIVGKVAVVTAATSPIGRATALRLADRGVRLVLVGSDSESLTELARECRWGGGREVETIAIDAHDANRTSTSEAVIAAAVERFGEVDAFVSVGADCGYPGDAALEHFNRTGQGVLVNVGPDVDNTVAPTAAVHVVSLRPGSLGSAPERAAVMVMNAIEHPRGVKVVDRLVHPRTALAPLLPGQRKPQRESVLTQR